ncbi:MAG TPA: GlxA family transcriptional regulator [Candidatus Udaeobacter sp.]|nr:GlxA family transcriptional regulator [Candidatus Udaeobacter sp.]
MAEDPQDVAFLLLPAFSNLSLMAAIEPLFIANWLAGRRLYRWQILSRDSRAVEASNGLPTPVDGGLAGVGRRDAVFLLASFDPRQHTRDARLAAWLRRAARYGAELGAIETASEIFAAAGLLDGHPAAVHWDNLEGFRELYPDCQASPQLFTCGRGRLTCAGEAAVLDMMVHWIGIRHGASLAGEIAQHLLLARQRGPEELQLAVLPAPPADDDPVLARALSIMEKAMEEPISCAGIARRAGLSLRQLQRLFRAKLGTGPLQHYRRMRLAKAHALLQQTGLPVTEVAVSAGFASPEHFSRVYRQAFGRPPSADRRQSTDAPVMRRPPRA